MDKRILLEARLKECGTSINYFYDAIPTYGTPVHVVAYTSHFDGLGNINSDFDVYVIHCRDNISSAGAQNFVRCGNTGILDIEYWHIDEIISKYVDISRTNFWPGSETSEIIKMLLRLRSGYEIQSDLHLENIDKLQLIIKDNKLDCLVKDGYLKLAGAELDDGIKLYKAKDLLCALGCVRRSLEYLTGALIAKNGKSCLKEKWFPKIICDNKAFGDHTFLDAYLELQYFKLIDQNTIEKHIEAMIDFIQTHLSRISIDLNF